MATDLYETLELTKDATPEQIRKAYKKKALQTHPDRLPPNATREEKAASEEMFRTVNNAYEVLSDPKNRKAYDQHGVWPPPEPSAMPRRSEDYPSHSHYRHRPFMDPFFDEAHRHPFSSFVFSDPFMLFDTVFGLDPHNRHSFRQHRHRSSPWAMEDPFQNLEADLDDFFDRRSGSGFGGGLSGGGFNSGFGFGFGFPSISMGFPSLIASSPLVAGGSGGGGQWASESSTTTTVNGVTQSIHKRRDWDGNEHVTRTYPDGRKIRTINGIEQPPDPRGYVPSHPERYATPSVPAREPRSSRTLGFSPSLPPYPGHPSSGYAGMGGGWHHDSVYPEPHYSDTRPVIPDRYSSPAGRNSGGEERLQRKRWWGRG